MVEPARPQSAYSRRPLSLLIQLGTVLAFYIELLHLPGRLELQWFQVHTFIIIANDYEIWVFKN